MSHGPGSSKKRRLQGLLNLQGVSDRALGSILKRMGVVATKRDVTEARHARLDAVLVKIELDREGGGEPIVWSLAHPNLLFASLVAESEVLQRVISEALERHPCSPQHPWNVLVGFDEFVPGDKLQLRNARKGMNLFFSFQEFGSACEVSGGWSRMLRDYLRLQMLSEESGLATVGVSISVLGRPVKIHAKVGQILSDGDGLRIALQWGGQGCMKPCWRHQNILRKGSGRAEFREGYEEITCADPDKFVTWPSDELYVAIDLLVEARERAASGDMFKARHEELTKAFGFNPTRDGLLACPRLRSAVDVPSVTRYDWAHTFLADGILTTSAWLAIRACEDHGIASQAELCDFLSAKWTFPAHMQHHGRQLYRLFDAHGARANSESGKLKANASELLTLYGLLRHWMRTHVPSGDDRVAEEIRLFELACDAVDAMMRVKHRSVAMADGAVLLRAALVRYMDTHKALFGDDHVRPKHHWSFDIIEQMTADAVLFDSFIVERMHLRVRDVAERCHDQRQYEQIVLSGLCNLHAHVLEAAHEGNGLIGRRAVCPELGGAWVGDALELEGFRLSMGDFVTKGGIVAHVRACAQEEAQLFIIVDEHQKALELTQRSATWVATGARSVWTLDGVVACSSWRALGGGQVLVLTN